MRILVCRHLIYILDQVVDELFAYWTLEDSEDTLEQLEELLIVRYSANTSETQVINMEKLLIMS
jgi:hypothetical protein